MLASVVIDIDYPNLMRNLHYLAREEVPFATAKTLTVLAQLSQSVVREQLSQHFTIRTPWLAKGIRIQKAEKRDWPDCSSVVYSKDWFMELQEDGGAKEPNKASMLAIPFAARPNQTDTTPRSMWPGALLRKKSDGNFVYFEQTLRSGDLAILRRKTTSKVDHRAPDGSDLAQERKAQHAEMELVYLFKPQVHIKKRWNFHEEVTSVVQQHYNAEFDKAMEYALSTRKR